MSMCPIGYHFVKKHSRKSQNGIIHTVEAHCRVNPQNKKNVLFESNLNYIFHHFKNIFDYNKLNRIKKFRDDGRHDISIQFWLNYWKNKKLISYDLDPLLIKAIIAVESSFQEKAITTISGSSATGLMQITKSTMSILAGIKNNEIRKELIEITQQEALSANSNIAAGTRWLIYKIRTSPWRNKKNRDEQIFGGLKYYHSWDEEGEKYANKVMAIYNESK